MREGLRKLANCAGKSLRAVKKPRALCKADVSEVESQNSAEPSCSGLKWFGKTRCEMIIEEAANFWRTMPAHSRVLGPP